MSTESSSDCFGILSDLIGVPSGPPQDPLEPSGLLQDLFRTLSDVPRSLSYRSPHNSCKNPSKLLQLSSGLSKSSIQYVRTLGFHHIS